MSNRFRHVLVEESDGHTPILANFPSGAAPFFECKDCGIWLDRLVANGQYYYWHEVYSCTEYKIKNVIK